MVNSTHLTGMHERHAEDGIIVAKNRELHLCNRYHDLTIQYLEQKFINEMDKVQTILGSLVIYYNRKLLDIDGFHNLTKIAKNLAVYRNDVLRNLNGFSQLEEVWGYVYILHNPKLENIYGFRRLSTIGDVLYQGFPDHYLKNLTDEFGITLNPMRGIILIEQWLS